MGIVQNGYRKFFKTIDKQVFYDIIKSPQEGVVLNFKRFDIKQSYLILTMQVVTFKYKFFM